MALKILQGKAKGLSLSAPNSGTRPTSVLLRRKIFDAHQDMGESIFIDGCAGSGAIGLEAASRGAHKVFLLENSRQAFKILKQNLLSFQQRLPEVEVEAQNLDCQKWLKKNLQRWNTPQSILFLDPPYEKKQTYHEVIQLLKQGQWQGELWLESDRQKGMLLSEFENEDLLGRARRVYKQGTSFIAIWSFG